VNRAEARKLLESSTRFQFQGDRLVVRDVALVAAAKHLGAVKEEIGVASMDVRLQEAALNLAA